ncbi:ABC-2 family transporter protein [Agrobacterium tumefaciens]|uniref:ABC-2 family transporter protein n=1 Tax=Agrobacterium tumefaciens TaxID=358 RepID=UPI001886102C|nr:ABC-2 family transporter protein [Agrobacterium tumefaciens]
MDKESDQEAASLTAILAYAIIASTILSTWEYDRIIRNFDQSLRSGTITSDLMRPIYHPLYLFLLSAGQHFGKTAVLSVPVCACALLLSGALPEVGISIVVFLILYLVSICIAFLLNIIFAFLTTVGFSALSCEWVLRGLLQLLSGSLVPLWFFPQTVQNFAAYLPFAWVTYYPASIYAGTMSASKGVGFFAGGVFWILALGAIAAVWWNAILRRTVAGGG